MKRITFSVTLLYALGASAQSAPPKPVKFMGREVTILDLGRDPNDELSPEGPASVCVEGPPQQQCYTTKEAATNANASIVLLKDGVPAILFSSDGGGVSGVVIDYVLLRPGSSRELADIFFPHIRVSNQGQQAFWDVPAISDSQIFVTADYVWGPNESHYGEHRFIVSAYVMKTEAESPGYYLEDQYMTAREHDRDAGADVLAIEKQEILRRLRAVQRK